MSETRETVKVESTDNKISWADISELEAENERQLQSMNVKFEGKPGISNTSMLSLLGVPQSQADNVRIFDEHPNGLQLVHYISSANKAVNHLRGVIVASAEMPPRIVCKSFPYTPEYKSDEFTMDDEMVASARLVPGYEGTILRVFFYDGEWYISTHKKINGKLSRWSSPTFGELFNECLGYDKDAHTDLSFLNPDYCYVFMMSHPQNSLVCKIPQPILYHIVSYDTRNNMQVVNEPIHHPRITYTPQLLLKTADELRAHVDQMSWQIFSGVIMFLSDGTMCKVINREYYMKRQIRGNEPNLRIRYLQLAEIPGMSSKDLVDLLPEKKDFFDKVERDLQRLVHHLYGRYEYRYVNGNFLRLPREEFYFLEAFHVGHTGLKGKYLSPDQKNSLKEEIREKLEDCSPREINAMIKSMLNDN